MLRSKQWIIELFYFHLNFVGEAPYWYLIQAIILRYAALPGYKQLGPQNIQGNHIFDIYATLIS